ncbi:MAG: LysE family translocator, partial [Salinarchaeum sp.]
MSSAIVSAFAGVLFGLALAAPPGPMNALIAEESVLRGWGAGFRAGLGAMTADLVFCVLALVGVVAIVDRVPALQTAMVAIGGVLMCYFAYEAVQEARGTFVDKEMASATAGFTKTFVLTLTNPYQVIFWLT